jgi:hypothetical protein
VCWDLSLELGDLGVRVRSWVRVRVRVRSWGYAQV